MEWGGVFKESTKFMWPEVNKRSTAGNSQTEEKEKLVGSNGANFQDIERPWLSPSGTPQNGTDVSHLGSPANTGAKHLVSLGVKRISGRWDSIESLSARGLLPTGRQTPRPCGHHASAPWAEPALEIRERVGGRDWDSRKPADRMQSCPRGQQRNLRGG